MEEKPKKEFLVSMGVYAVNKRVLDFIPKNKFLDLIILWKDL